WRDGETEGRRENLSVPLSLCPSVPPSLRPSVCLALVFNSRDRDRALEFDSQDGAWFESDVVAFGHHHAAEHARSNAARETAKSTSRRPNNCPAERAEPAANPRVLRRAFAGTSGSNFAFTVLGFQLVVVGVVVNGHDGNRNLLGPIRHPDGIERDGHRGLFLRAFRGLNLSDAAGEFSPTRNDHTSITR